MNPYTLGARHAIAVSSGAAALTIALSALGIGAGDEVIVPALTAPATARAIRRAGATLVFVDVDPVSRTLDPDVLDSAIGRAPRPSCQFICTVHPL